MYNQEHTKLESDVYFEALFINKTLTNAQGSQVNRSEEAEPENYNNSGYVEL